MPSISGGGSGGSSSFGRLIEHVTNDLSGSGGNYTVPNGSPHNGPAPTLWIQGGTHAYDGATVICIEVYVAATEPQWGQAICMNLHEDSTDLGLILNGPTPNYNASGLVRGGGTFYYRGYRTPAAGNHAYATYIYSTGGTTSFVYSGAAPSATSDFAIAYQRITVAA